MILPLLLLSNSGNGAAFNIDTDALGLLLGGFTVRRDLVGLNSFPGILNSILSISYFVANAYQKAIAGFVDALWRASNHLIFSLLGTGSVEAMCLEFILWSLGFSSA